MMSSDEVSSSSITNAEHQTVSICQVDKDLLAQMQQNLSTQPKILLKSAGSSSCCIYRFPRNLVDVYSQCCQPKIVSIGPYNHGLPHLQMMEEHKWRYLSLLLNRIQTKNLTLEDLLKAVQPLESRARECYSETILFDQGQLIKILVLDGCFIIEFFRRFKALVPFEADDPINTMIWILDSFQLDLIRLENQIPFFILDCLFKLTQMPGEEKSYPSLAMLTLKFFRSAVPMYRPDDVISKYRHFQGKHILDLLRSSFTNEIDEVGEGGSRVNTSSKMMPVNVDCCWPMAMVLDQSHTRTTCEVGEGTSYSTQCISNLRRAGIRLKPGQENSFLNIKYSPGVIKMPKIVIDHLMREFLVNCVAYEQCHMSDQSLAHMTTYVIFLDCLINTSSDVGYLCEKNIIDNYLGSDDEAAKFINDLGKNVVFMDGYLSSLLADVNDYYKNKWHVRVATFKYTYFSTPWSFISAMAAFILLVLTVLGTLFTILGYKN